MADPRAELRQAISKAISTCVAATEQREAATDAVMKIFWSFDQRVEEHETTTYGDRFEQIVWSRMIVAEHVAESGSYSGKPGTR